MYCSASHKKLYVIICNIVPWNPNGRLFVYSLVKVKQGHKGKSETKKTSSTIQPRSPDVRLVDVIFVAFPHRTRTVLRIWSPAGCWSPSRSISTAGDSVRVRNCKSETSHLAFKDRINHTETTDTPRHIRNGSALNSPPTGGAVLASSVCMDVSKICLKFQKKPRRGGGGVLRPP